MQRDRIFLVHATDVAIEPINQAFLQLWPEACVANLLEDSLSADLAVAGRLTPELKHRFMLLATYAMDAGAKAILFTCSAFGEAVEWCNSQLPIPVLKPNEAMIEAALEKHRRIALLATFAPAMAPITAEFYAHADKIGKDVQIKPYLIPKALEALKAGDQVGHDRLIADFAREHIEDAGVICLAQFSMTRSQPMITLQTGLPVLATPDSAVKKLQRIITSQGNNS